jgi:hypothetical protein
VCPDRRGQKCARTTPSWCPCQRRRTQHRDRAAVHAQRCSQGEGRGTGALEFPAAPKHRRVRPEDEHGDEAAAPGDCHPTCRLVCPHRRAAGSTAPRPRAPGRRRSVLHVRRQWNVKANALARPKADSVRTVVLPAGQRGARLSQTALDTAWRAAREETPGRRRPADRRPRGVARRPRHPADPSPAPQARPRRNPTQPGTRPDATGDSARRLRSPADRRQTLSGRSYEPASDKLSVTGSTNVPHTTYPAPRGDRSRPAPTPRETGVDTSLSSCR